MRYLTVAIALMSLWLALPSVVQASTRIGDLQFSGNFDSLMAQAQQSQKVVIIDWFTDWCVWCKKMADTTLPDLYVQKFLNNFEIGKINAEVDTMTAARFGVRSFPTVLVLKPNGMEIDRIVGYLPPVEFVTAIVNAMSGIGTLDDLLNKLARKPKDIELIYEIGQKYRWRGDYDKAATYFQEVMMLDLGNGKKMASQAAFNLGHMQYKKKNYTAAIASWRDMIAAYPQDSVGIEAQLMIALSYQNAKDFKMAKAEFKSFLKKYPDTEEKDWINEQLAKMEKK